MTGINGVPVVECTIVMPLHGLWHAHVSADSHEDITGAAVLDVSGVQLRGTVLRGSSLHGRVQAIVVGGAGTLSHVIGPKAYRGVPVDVPLKDIASETGQPLADDCTSTGELLVHWLRVESQASGCLDMLARHVGALWRVKADGRLWFGADAWPETDVEYEVIDADGAEQSVQITGETGLVVPGTCLHDGRRVSRAVHDVSQSKIRSKVLVEDGS